MDFFSSSTVIQSGGLWSPIPIPMSMPRQWNMSGISNAVADGAMNYTPQGRMIKISFYASMAILAILALVFLILAIKKKSVGFGIAVAIISCLMIIGMVIYRKRGTIARRAMGSPI